MDDHQYFSKREKRQLNNIQLYLSRANQGMKKLYRLYFKNIDLIEPAFVAFSHEVNRTEQVDRDEFHKESAMFLLRKENPTNPINASLRRVFSFLWGREKNPFKLYNVCIFYEGASKK